MQFKYIRIKNLFGLYNYNIEFFHKDEDKLTILTGPNGYGKTTVLTILDNLSPESLYYFYLLKYETIEIGLSDETYLLIDQCFSQKKDEEKDKTSDTKQASVKEVRFSWLNKDNVLLCYFLYNDNVIRKAKRNAGFYHRFLIGSLEESTNNTDNELLKNKRFNEYIAHDIGQDIFLMQLESLRTKFIHANRIYNEANEENDVLPIQRIRQTLQKELSLAYQNYLQAECSLQTTTPLVEKVAKDLKSLSYLRLYNEVTVANNELEGIELDGINFNDITYSALYDGENAITWEQCLGHVKSTCNNSRLEHYPTTEMIKLFANSYINPDLKQLTRGHDLVFALQVRLQKLNRKNSLGYKDLCLILRNTCPKEKFEETNLYHQLNEWMNQQGRYLWHNKVA